MTRPLRVAQVCSTVDGGLWMVQIAVGLRRRGFDVVAIIGGAGGGTEAAVRKAGIPYVVFPQRLGSSSRIASLLGRVPVLHHARRLFDYGQFLRDAVRLAWLLRRLRVDIVHSHVVPSMLLTRIGGSIARIPVRVSMIAGPLHLESERLRELDLATLRFDHQVLAGCAYTEELYASLGVPSRKRRTVGYGVDPAGFDPDQADGESVRRELGLGDRIVIGQVAFFYPPIMGPAAPPGMRGRGIKGHEDVIAAARIVIDRYPEARFLLVGDGFGPEGVAYFARMRQTACDLGLGDAIVFPGRRADLTNVLATLDISIHASLSENYGGTIESLLMARPMVATRAGGIPEVILHEQTGLLVEPHDPEGLAAGIIRLIEDPDLARRLGAAGRRFALERHTIQRTIDGVVEAYADIARRQGLDGPPLGAASTSGSPPLGGLGLMPSDVLFTEDGA